MTDIKLKIEPEDVKAMLAQALRATLTPEVRDKLVQGAIHDLMKSSYQSASELQDIFSRAARDVAYDIMKEEFERPERREQLREVVNEAFNKVLKDNDRRDTLVDKLADGIGQVLSGRRY